jgi:hypothetical protein
LNRRVITAKDLLKLQEARGSTGCALNELKIYGQEDRMDLQKGIPRPKVEREEIIDAYTKCILCGSDLSFSYTTDFINMKLKEQASCTCCGVKNRTHEFVIN